MSSQTNTSSGPLSISLTAHEDSSERLLLFTISCGEVDHTPAPLDIALVLDRSGSMSGQKLDIARRATAEFIRSLDPRDTISVVTYDSRIDIVAARSHPSEELANRVAQIEPGGNTNLYEGWLTGAKLLHPGGRVMLLSDGLANEGAYRDATSLGTHASISLERFRIATTTIGVGNDYDEALMAGMARMGGGAHYYAHTADAIREAFGQERFSLGATVIGAASIRLGGETVQVGQFWPGEVKRVVVPVNELTGPLTLRYQLAGKDHPTTVELDLPRQFGYSDDATLERLIAQAADLEYRSIEVRNPGSAAQLGTEIRELILKLLAHPLADSDLARPVLARLNASRDRLERLRHRYDEAEATMHRKRSLQSSHNMRDKARAYSSFEEEKLLVAEEFRVSMPAAAARPVVDHVDRSAFKVIPVEQWRAWGVVPLHWDGQTVHVGTPNARDGFLQAEIEKAAKRSVKLVQMDEVIVRALLERAV